MIDIYVPSIGTVACFESVEAAYSALEGASPPPFLPFSSGNSPTGAHYQPMADMDSLIVFF